MPIYHHGINISGGVVEGPEAHDSMLVRDEEGGGDDLVDVAETGGNEGDQVVAPGGVVGRDAPIEDELRVVQFHQAVHVAYAH